MGEGEASGSGVATTTGGGVRRRASIRKQGPCVGAAWRGAPAHPRITGLPGTLARATRSRRPLSIFASTCSCAPRVFRRASQGPQGRVVPFGVTSGVRGEARIVGYVLQSSSADRAESLGLQYRGVSSPPHTVILCMGVRGPGIAELCSVVSRVASCNPEPNNLILS